MAFVVAPALDDEPLEPVLPFGVREEEADKDEDESYVSDESCDSR